MSAIQCGNSILTFHAYISVILNINKLIVIIIILKLFEKAKVQWYHIGFYKGKRERKCLQG